MTYDLSYNRRESLSLNQRVQENEMPEVIFGLALLCFLYLIHRIRWSIPNKRILCNKIDVEKAYRRLNTQASIAVKCIAVWFLDETWNNSYQKSDQQAAVFLTHLPFRSTQDPAEFGITHETVFNLFNDLLYCNQWDPPTIPSPYATALPDPVRFSEDIEFGKAEEADV